MTHAGFIQLFVTRRLFKTIIGDKETLIIHVASVITFNLFSDLLCNPTLNLYVAC